VNWQLTADVGEFFAAAGNDLAADPVENTLLLTIADGDRRAASTSPTPDSLPPAAAAPLYGWRAGNGPGAFVHTPGFPVVLGAMPGAAAAALAELIPPAPPPGRPRGATAADRDLLAAWISDFLHEAGAAGDTRGAAMADGYLAYGGLLGWEDGGRLVATAARTRVVGAMARIGPVYTPPEQRGKGYGGAVTPPPARPPSRPVPVRWCCSPIWPTRPATPSTSGLASGRSLTGCCCRSPASDTQPRSCGA